MKVTSKRCVLLSLIAFLVIGLTITLSACSASCTPIATKHSVRFMVDGQVYSAFATNGEEAVTLPTAPEKAGYAFEGWYLDDGVWNQPFDGNSLLEQKLTENVNVYAKWNAISYTVTCAAAQNGTLICDLTTATVGTTVTVTATPHTQWELKSISVNGVKITGTTFTMPAENVTVTAVFAYIEHWSPNA